MKTLAEAKTDAVRLAVIAALRESKSYTEAARGLGISRVQLYRLIKADRVIQVLLPDRNSGFVAG